MTVWLVSTDAKQATHTESHICQKIVYGKPYVQNDVQTVCKLVFGSMLAKNCIAATLLYRRQIDITTYQLLFFLSDTSLCLFGDDMLLSDDLRARTFLHQAFQVYHVCCNSILGNICWITVIFGTLKDRSNLIYISASTNCLSDRNIFQNGVNALSKIGDAFLTNSWRFHLVYIIWLCSNFACLCHKHLLWHYKRNFRLPIPAFATVTKRKKHCWTINILHKFLCSSSSMFPLLLLTV